MAEQRRRVLAIRVPQDTFDVIAARAAAADVDVSHMARRMLMYAQMEMPELWIPPTSTRSKP